MSDIEEIGFLRYKSKLLKSGIRVISSGLFPLKYQSNEWVMDVEY